MLCGCFSCAEWPGRSLLLGLRILQQNGKLSCVGMAASPVIDKLGLSLPAAVGCADLDEGPPGLPNAKEEAVGTTRRPPTRQAESRSADPTVAVIRPRSQISWPPSAR